MKHSIKNFFVIAITSILALSYTNSRVLSSAKGTCSISSISMPVGSSSPVMTYNARVENENWSLTVIDKDQNDKYKVDGNLFYTDKKSGDAWYTNKNVDDKVFDSMRDAFSLCRTLNDDNKETKAFEKSRLYEKLRTSTLPQNVNLRKTEKAEKAEVENKTVDSLKTPTVATTSFLQMGMKMKLKMRMSLNGEDDDIIDENLEKELEDLEKDENPDLLAEQDHILNNEARDANKELETELNIDNGDEHSTSDLILD